MNWKQPDWLKPKIASKGELCLMSCAGRLYSNGWSKLSIVGLLKQYELWTDHEIITVLEQIASKKDEEVINFPFRIFWFKKQLSEFIKYSRYDSLKEMLRYTFEVGTSREALLYVLKYLYPKFYYDFDSLIADILRERYFQKTTLDKRVPEGMFWDQVQKRKKAEKKLDELQTKDLD